MEGLNTTSPATLRLFPTAVPLDPPPPHKAGSVAVVMRTKNRPILLHRGLSSVLSQSYGNWHLYLVNDGGDAKVLEDVLAIYESAFGDRLTVINHAESRGMENASNAALAHTTAEFAVIHDDDDSWHPDFLDATTAFLADPANRHCVGVTTGCRLITERIVGELVEEVGSSEWLHNQRLTDFGAILGGNTFPPICFLFRRAAVDRIGAFNGALPVLGDWEFNIRALMLGEIDFLPRTLANYHHRVRGTGSSYGNTVVDGQRMHDRHNVLLRNSIMRAAILESPATIAVLQSQVLLRNRLLEAIENLGRLGHERDSDTHLDRRLGEIEDMLREMRMVASWHRKLLRPVHWIWVKLMPMRRMVARARGRA